LAEKFRRPLRGAGPTEGKGFFRQPEERHNRLDEDRARERLVALVAEMNYECERGAMVVVEGVRDENALTSLGFKGLAFKLCYTKRSLSTLTSQAESHRRVILLLDYDLKGRALTKKVASLLQDKGIDVNMTFRREIRAITNGLANHIEDLKRFSKARVEALDV
jgi:5S rRNA maturation endonuclease (ribonuclease M5)